MLLNTQRARAVMERHGIDILIGTSPENVTYCTDFWSFSNWGMPTGECYAVLYVDNLQDPYLILPHGEIDMVLDQHREGLHFFTYGASSYELAHYGIEIDNDALKFFPRMADDGLYSSGREALLDLFQRNDWRDVTVGIDERGTSPSLFSFLSRNVRGLRVREAYDVFQEIRAVKTKEEIDRVRKATAITEKAISAVVSELRIGITERELATIFDRTVVEEGAMPFITDIGWGPHSAFGNCTPSNRKIGKDNVLRFDVGCRYKHYCSDMSRIVVVGKATTRQLRYYEAILEGQKRALDLIRPGAIAGDIYQAAIDAVRQSGIPHYKRPHVGHGIGIEVYQPPILKPDDSTSLEKGMVICVETPYYELGAWGLQVEDTVVVTNDGFEFLTKSSRELRTIDVTR